MTLLGMGLLATVVFSGCGGYSGPPLAQAKGKVTLDGAAVEGAVVTFNSEDGSITASGVTDANGVYEMAVAQGGKSYKGAPIGTNKVSITKTKSGLQANDGGGGQSNPNPEADYKGDMSDMFKDVKGKGDMSKIDTKSVIPAKYGSAISSGFTAVVEKGKVNEIPEFAMKSGGGGGQGGQGQGQ